ncbi:MAG TPA: 4Fe-4S binding protein [Anaerolineales bacterium]|nr:4Fe-4S binding protein [Anaerolineales bacterium]
MFSEAYKRLAERLDSLPNGFPPTEDGIELHLLSLIFTSEEAQLASHLRLGRETPEQIAARIGADPTGLRDQLKGMARRGLIGATRLEGGIGYGLIPFVVGIYENQVARLDAEMSRIFEDYYQRAFGQMLGIQPSVHRVIPVGESVRMDMEVRPYESAADILDNAQAWGVLDCICRKQKALIGDPCEHPLDVCMALSQKPGAFDQNPVIRAVTREQAQSTLQRAAAAGLVHSVSNSQSGLGYICNCCTCSCGILRGMTELGIANVVARSPFVNQVEEELCYGCELCLDYCQFEALTLEDGLAAVNQIRCVGCGVCVPSCPDKALSLVRRPAEEVLVTPANEMAWLQERAQARGLDLHSLM